MVIRDELQLWGYFIVRTSEEATPIVLTELGWNSAEEVLEYVNATAMVAHHSEMFVIEDTGVRYENRKGDAIMVIGQLDTLLQELMSVLHDNTSILWGNAFIETAMRSILPPPSVN